MRIAILGAGIGGLSLAYFLNRASCSKSIDLFERAPTAGGLVKGFSHRGQVFDRHYHVVLVSDRDLLGVVTDLHLESRLSFKVSKMGFFDGARLIPFNNPLDFALFPMLGPFDKVRLLATILYCQQWGEPAALHLRPLEPWLVRMGGERAFERVWAPLLRSKFDGSFDRIPATYLWSRMRRMQSTREHGGAVEKLGILKGGTSSLVEALAEALPERGIGIHCGVPVKGLRIEGRKTRIELESGVTEPYDLVISTLPTSIHDRIAGPSGASARYRMPDRYLGIVDVVVALDHSLTPYYTLNLLDPTLPFTGIIETTNLMEPRERGDTHLVYLPRYTDASGPIYQKPDNVIKGEFVGRLLEAFPRLRPDAIQAVYVFREPFVEPIHHVGGDFSSFPDSLATHRRRIYIMNTGRLYPALHNCQAVVSMARRTAEYLMERHG